MTHVAIVGAGAVGGFLAARLSARGYRVTIVARGAQLEAIRAHGLLVREPDGTTHRYRLEAMPTLAQHPDLVLLAVKTQDLTHACEEIRPGLKDAPVVALQNGLQADHLAASVLGRRQVLGGVAMCAVSFLRPGEVEVQFPGWLVLGRLFGPLNQDVAAAAEILETAVPTYRTGQLRRVRWTKLIANLNNGLCAATGLSLPEVADSPLARQFSLYLMREGCAVAAAAGVRLDRAPYIWTRHALRQGARTALLALLQAMMTSVVARAPEPIALRLLAVTGHSRMARLPVRFSTWQSLARGRPTEIGYLNGEIVRLGARLGCPVPYNQSIVEAVQRIERGAPYFPLEDLLPRNVHQMSTPSTAGV
jgi:2-dehydropantoate 2-reductase